MPIYIKAIKAWRTATNKSQYFHSSVQNPQSWGTEHEPAELGPHTMGEKGALYQDFRKYLSPLNVKQSIQALAFQI